MIKVTEDVYKLLKHENNSLTTKDLDKLEKLVEISIIEAAVEAKLAEENIAELDLGFGTLYIKCDGEVKTKLVLADSFKERIVEYMKLNKSDLDAKLNEALVTRITHIYKDLLQ